MNDSIAKKSPPPGKLLVGSLVMTLSIIFMIALVQIGMGIGVNLMSLTRSLGIKMTPNLDGGYPIAEFNDPANDLYLAPGENLPAAAKAFDLRKFSVRKVQFHPLSAMGIAPRLNLLFQFDGQLPSAPGQDPKSGLPIIAVYIDAPDLTSKKIISSQIADVDFAGGQWDYQVIIDRNHDQAGIFDANGYLLGQGLGLYINSEMDTSGSAFNRAPARVKSTVVTAALPIEIVGDPGEGQWSYYVVVGRPRPEDPAQMQVWDWVQPEGAGPTVIEAGARPRLLPLQVLN